MDLPLILEVTHQDPAETLSNDRSSACEDVARAMGVGVPGYENLTGECPRA